MLPPLHWVHPSDDLFRNLSQSEVHVWRAFLGENPEHTARYHSVLSEEERARAERFRVPHARNEFVTTRAILRHLLCRYAEIPAAQLRIEDSSNGKPELRNSSSLSFRFNVSHTRGMALLAFTVHHDVGIDVERIDRTINEQEIASRYFSPRESAHLASLSPKHRTQEFFKYWTCKEAYLKMQGIGLRGGLAQCRIEFHPDGRKAGVVSADGSGKVSTSSLFPLQVSEKHIGAVAVDSLTVHATFWDWEH